MKLPSVLHLTCSAKEPNPLKVKLKEVWGSWKRNEVIHAAAELQQEGTS